MNGLWDLQPDDPSYTSASETEPAPFDETIDTVEEGDGENVEGGEVMEGDQDRKVKSDDWKRGMSEPRLLPSKSRWETYSTRTMQKRWRHYETSLHICTPVNR